MIHLRDNCGKVVSTYLNLIQIKMCDAENLRTYGIFNQSIKVLFNIQTNNNNIHAFINMNTERAGNEVILLI